MKSKFILSALAFVGSLVLLFSACNKLNLKPLDRLTADNFYVTQSDFDGAAFSAYSSMQDMYSVDAKGLLTGSWGTWWAAMLSPTDDIAINTLSGHQGDGGWTEARDLDNLNLRATNRHIGALYSEVYAGINRANILIEQVNNGKNQLTATQKSQYMGEGKFIRGFFTFLAGQIWGPAPLLLKSSSEPTTYTNSTQDSLFSQAARDFNDAYQALPTSWSSNMVGRATKYAARAFEGKVYVWQKKWQQAVVAFEDVEARGNYSLVTNFNNNFNTPGENNTESIFEIQFGGPSGQDNGWVFDSFDSENFKASQGTARIWFYLIDCQSFGCGGNRMAWYVPTQSLVSEFTAYPADNRYDLSVYHAATQAYYSDNGGVISTHPYDASQSSTGYAMAKYLIDPTGFYTNNVSGNNERFYRYSELLLLHAEALLSGGTPAGGSIYQTAASLVNATRARAGLLPLAIVTTADMRSEKRKELAFEPPRYFDMIRWGIGGAKIFPFPQSEIDRNLGSLKQNP